jgi:hypothetical protein
MRWREQDAVKKETNRKQQEEQIHKNKESAKEVGDVNLGKDGKQIHKNRKKAERKGDVSDRKRR